MAEARTPQKSLPKINPVDAPFWQGAANDKFLLQKCKSCGKVQFFPRVACVDCFGELAWIESKGTGKIHTFTLVRVPRNPAFKDEVPYVVAIVATAEGPHLLTRIAGVASAEMRVGIKVRVKIEKSAEGVALPVFEPEAA